MIYGLFLLLFMNNFKLNMPLKNGYFCAFSVNILWGKCESSYFTDCNKYRQLKISYLAQVQSFQITFLRLMTVRAGGEKKIHSKAAAFIKISPNQSILRMDTGGGNLKSLLVYLAKESCSRPRKNNQTQQKAN